MHADARDAQESYTQIYQNSGGGRTEITRDRVKRQQTDRSKNDNRTRAHRTVIMVGATSADGWAASPAKKQVAAIKRRAGQNVGPLPFEAIIESCEPIINRKETAKRWIRRTRDTIPSTSCNRVYVIPKSRKPFLDKQNQDGGANNLVFEFRGNQTDAQDQSGRRNERVTHASINDAAHRRVRTKHHLIRVLHLRVASLSEGVHPDKGVRRVERAASDRTNDSALRRVQTRHHPIRVLLLRVASLSERVRLDKGIRHHPIRVLRLRAASLSEGVQLDKRIRRVEPEVPGREGARTQDEWKDGTAWGTDPTPTDFGIEYTGRAQMVATWSEPVTTDL